MLLFWEKEGKEEMAGKSRQNSTAHVQSAEELYSTSREEQPQTSTAELKPNTLETNE